MLFSEKSICAAIRKPTFVRRNGERGPDQIKFITIRGSKPIVPAVAPREPNIRSRASS